MGYIPKRELGELYLITRFDDALILRSPGVSGVGEWDTSSGSAQILKWRDRERERR